MGKERCQKVDVLIDGGDEVVVRGKKKVRNWEGKDLIKTKSRPEGTLRLRLPCLLYFLPLTKIAGAKPG